VDSKLRLSPCIFAAGDGTEMADHPNLPRSGVIAVHQGRHLVHNIRNALNGLEPSDFKIKNKLLNILITGENSARLVWGNFSFEGKLPLRLKNWIDQRYMSSFEKV
jgi:NADH dehydrogenase FAD-containing subunit